MTDITIIYKVTCLIVGLVFGYMGYQLFLRSIWGKSGDVEIQYRDNKMLVKAAAPGTFFALFGMLIIIFTIVKGIDIKETTTNSEEGNANVAQSTQSILPAEPPF